MLIFRMAFQPFGRALIESGKAFFEMEQKRNALRRVHESVSRKSFDLSNSLKFLSFMLHLFLLTSSFSMQLRNQPPSLG